MGRVSEVCAEVAAASVCTPEPCPHDLKASDPLWHTSGNGGNQAMPISCCHERQLTLHGA
eukprot:scaffold5926_cov21-Tisochrysis_lutea.AAC.1